MKSFSKSVMIKKMLIVIIFALFLLVLAGFVFAKLGDSCAQHEDCKNECQFCNSSTNKCEIRAGNPPCTDDGNICTMDVCDAGDCDHTMPQNEGEPCEDGDGNFCTGKCDDFGECKPIARYNTLPCNTDGDNDPCTGVCNNSVCKPELPSTHQCSTVQPIISPGPNPGEVCLPYPMCWCVTTTTSTTTTTTNGQVPEFSNSGLYLVLGVILVVAFVIFLRKK